MGIGGSKTKNVFVIEDTSAFPRRLNLSWPGVRRRSVASVYSNPVFKTIFVRTGRNRSRSHGGIHSFTQRQISLADHVLSPSLPPTFSAGSDREIAAAAGYQLYILFIQGSTG